MISYDLNNCKKNVLLLKIFITVIVKVLKAKTIISISANCRSVLPTQQEPVSLQALYNLPGEVITVCPQKRETTLLPVLMTGVYVIAGS